MSHRYWGLTIAGYLLILVAVALLGLVGRIDLASPLNRGAARQRLIITV